jgi:hypothetical protein
MRNRRKNRLLRRLALGLAVAAIVAPAASAAVDEVGTAQSDGGSSAVIKGDDKVIAGVGSHGIVIKGDDKVLTPAPKTGLFVRGGDDKVILTPADWQYNEHGYAQGHYRDVATQIRDTEPVSFTGGKPAGRQVPIAATGTGNDFDWADGLVGAVVALGIAGMAYAAVRSTRGMRRPATT